MCVATTFCHVYLKLGIDYVKYRQIADWLGDYEYKKPDQQQNFPTLNIALLAYTNGDIQKAFSISTITKHFTTEEQLQIAKWISASYSFPIVHF